MVTEKGSVGHHTLDNKALTQRHGGQEQGASCALGCRMQLLWGGSRAATHFTGREAPPRRRASGSGSVAS